MQHLLDRGLGVAGVAIHPAPTPGIGLGFDTVVSALPVLGDPFSAGKVKQMTKKFFAARFANGLPRAQVDAHFDRYIVPTAGKVYWDGVLHGGAGPITWNSSMKKMTMKKITSSDQKIVRNEVPTTIDDLSLGRL